MVNALYRVSAKVRARFQQMSLRELYDSAIALYVYVLHIVWKVTYLVVI